MYGMKGGYALCKRLIFLGGWVGGVCFILLNVWMDAAAACLAFCGLAFAAVGDHALLADYSISFALNTASRKLICSEY